MGLDLLQMVRHRIAVGGRIEVAPDSVIVRYNDGGRQHQMSSVLAQEPVDAHLRPLHGEEIHVRRIQYHEDLWGIG